MALFWPSSNQPKPRRMLGRRSMCVNRNNTTLNGTLNSTTKNTEFSKSSNVKDFSEPSCASTPLPIQIKNKENVLLSSIKKPPLKQSPQSVRKVPYERSRMLGRRSPYVRKTNESDKEENFNLSNSINHMKNINTSLKLTEPKLEPKVGLQDDSSRNKNFLNFEKYDFLNKYFSRSNLPSPPKPEFRYESCLKSMTSKYESITEASESPTEIFPISNTNTANSHALKKTQMQPSSSELYGSFSEDATSNSHSMDATVLNKDQTENDRNNMEPSTSSTIKQNQEDKLEENKTQSEDLNRTFEIGEENDEEDNLTFKTPAAHSSRIYKHDQSVFKTPLALSRVFDNFEDQNDSFVENERTVMLQFNNKSQFDEAKDSKTVENNVSNGTKSLEKFLESQQADFEKFMEEQNNLRRNFMAQQKKQLFEFIVSMHFESSFGDGTLKAKVVPEINIIPSDAHKKSIFEDASNTVSVPRDVENHNGDIEQNEGVPEPRPSLAYSTFKKRCSILKTPVHSKVRACANTTAVFTPRSLSVCIRDQLQSLENDEA